MKETTDREKLFREKVQDLGQAAVARAIGYSPSAVNQALHGKYAGDMNRMLTAVAETYGMETVDCPVLGEISISRCATERRTEASNASPVRVALYRACKSCPQGGGHA